MTTRKDFEQYKFASTFFSIKNYNSFKKVSKLSNETIKDIFMNYKKYENEFK